MLKEKRRRVLDNGIKVYEDSIKEANKIDRQINKII